MPCTTQLDLMTRHDGDDDDDDNDNDDDDGDYNGAATLGQS